MKSGLTSDNLVFFRATIAFLANLNFRNSIATSANGKYKILLWTDSGAFKSLTYSALDSSHGFAVAPASVVILKIELSRLRERIVDNVMVRTELSRDCMILPRSMFIASLVLAVCAIGCSRRFYLLNLRDFIYLKFY